MRRGSNPRTKFSAGDPGSRKRTPRLAPRCTSCSNVNPDQLTDASPPKIVHDNVKAFRLAAQHDNLYWFNVIVSLDIFCVTKELGAHDSWTCRRTPADCHSRRQNAWLPLCGRYPTSKSIGHQPQRGDSVTALAAGQGIHEKKIQSPVRATRCGALHRRTKTAKQRSYRYTTRTRSDVKLPWIFVRI